jgi:tryptophanyl-tRNA synthetase
MNQNSGEYNMQKQIALTGIRPAAGLTIYDYFEPLNRLMTLHKDYTCLLLIADYHALKTDSNVGVDIEEHVRNVVLDVLAAGFDVDKGVCFLQSQVPQLAEFASILGNLVQVDQLLDPEEANQESYGFLGYSIFQAADILMFRPRCVPIGSNQECRILLTQDLAK